MRKIQKTALVGGTVATLLAGGVAFAAWTSTGSGNATVQAGEAKGLEVSGNPAVTGLFPTGNKDVTIHIKNANDYPVTLDDITAGTISNDKSAAGCVNSAVTADSSVNNGTRLAAGETKDFTFNVQMGASSDNGCQLATFTVPYTASAHSSN